MSSTFGTGNDECRCIYGMGGRCSHCDSRLRPISVEFHSTPQLYIAYFRDEYDGAPDSHHPMGFGKTEAEAIADLRSRD